MLINNEEIKMKLELKAIKHSEFASEETFCYQANLYLNGKKVAQVSNQGFGGCDSQDFDSSDIEKAVNDYFKTLPKRIITMGKSGHEVFGEPIELDADLESWCSDQVCEWLIVKDAKKMLKKFHYFRKSDKQIYSIKVSGGKSHKLTPVLISNVKKAKWWSDDCICLNELPLNEVIQYMKEA
jgi:hypothetical protein